MTRTLPGTEPGFRTAYTATHVMIDQPGRIVIPATATTGGKKMDVGEVRMITYQAGSRAVVALAWDTRTTVTWSNGEPLPYILDRLVEETRPGWWPSAPAGRRVMAVTAVVPFDDLPIICTSDWGARIAVQEMRLTDLRNGDQTVILNGFAVTAANKPMKRHRSVTWQTGDYLPAPVAALITDARPGWWRAPWPGPVPRGRTVS